VGSGFGATATGGGAGGLATGFAGSSPQADKASATISARMCLHVSLLLVSGKSRAMARRPPVLWLHISFSYDDLPLGKNGFDLLPAKASACPSPSPRR
jgi:hypothetical protein